MPPKILLTTLLILAAFCVNAQTFKDSTYSYTHDTSANVLVKTISQVPYDSTYKAPQRDTIYSDTSYQYCKIRKRSLLTFYWLFGGSPTYRYCDDVPRPRREYDDTVMQVLQTHAKTPLKDTTSTFLKDTATFHVESVRFLTTHDTIVQVLIPVIIEFGAKLQGSVPDQITSLNALNAKWVRTSVILQDFTGIEKALDKYMDAGLKIACNVRWTSVVPSPFCTDTIAYINKLKLFLDNYAAKIKSSGGIILCENEPMNLNYYGTAPIENYITLLKVFVRIAQPYGINTSDGCLFIEYLNVARTGIIPVKIKDKIATQAKLIAAYKTIPLTFLNVHISIHDDFLETDIIKLSLDYLRVQTGKKDVITNEYHYERCTANSGITNKVISEWKKSGVPICIVWSGDQLEGQPPTSGNSPAMALSLDAALTALGISQRDATK